jgi:hypothetical protein
MIILIVSALKSAWKGLKKMFEEVLNRMEMHREELERLALAEYMKDTRAWQDCTLNL